MDSSVSHITRPAKHSASGGRSCAFKSALVCTVFFSIYSVVAVLADPLVEYTDRMQVPQNATHAQDAEAKSKSFSNPLYHTTEEYRLRRRAVLLGLTRREAMFARRMLAAVVFGAMIGLERRESNRGAGIRTMSLVSLGACIFTLASTFGFEDGTQEWDASRVSAALPAGVGFLGGALIFKDKGAIKGLTTACGLWLSCAVGMCCGGGLYFPSGFGVCGMVAVLRFGPRSFSEAEFDGDATVEHCASASEPKATRLSEPLLHEEEGMRATASGVKKRPSALLVGDE
mmetsp:Transcript_86193/g.241080  ORF Transcript_86193/g.241080 Transcript_86193/m.241080 type:complete len:286 (-) Transcript_86193:46-903(-)